MATPTESDFDRRMREGREAVERSQRSTRERPLRLQSELVREMQEAREVLDSARRRLAEIDTTPGSPKSADLVKESAEVQAAAVRELGSTIESAINAFSIASAASSADIKRWTKVQAWATIILAVLTLTLAFITAAQTFRWFE